MDLTVDQMIEISRIMEGYARNPSNSNKYLHEMYAYIQEIGGK